MKTYGWVSAQRDPPERWDLRRLGWHLCGSERRVECRHVLIVDAPREVVANTDRLFRHLLMVGVDDPLERARLLTMGYAEAVPSTIGLPELEARARRVNEMFGMLPRWRTFGSLTLDLFHRDARSCGRWLALHPREFKLLWRLADRPGERVSRGQLLRDVWRLSHAPETNSVEVHVSRLRAKLAEHGCGGVVLTDPRGGYRLGEPEPVARGPDLSSGNAIDTRLRLAADGRFAQLAAEG